MSLRVPLLALLRIPLLRLALLGSSLGLFISPVASRAFDESSPDRPQLHPPLQPRLASPLSPPLSVEKQLKAALVESQNALGPLQPWQKVIFDEEVVPDYQRFIRDYKVGSGTSSGSIKVDVDLESLKNYLSFHSSKLVSKLVAKLVTKTPENPSGTPEKSETTETKIWVLFNSDPKCEPCRQSSQAIQDLALARLRRRGLTPLLGKLQDLSLPPKDPKRLETQSSAAQLEKQAVEVENKSIEVSQRQKAEGVLVVQWYFSPLPLEDENSPYASENHYIMRVFLKVGRMTLNTRQSNLLDTDSFEGSEARLLTDLFVELGTKSALETSLALHRLPQQVHAGLSSGSEASAEDDEILVEVSELRDFSQYQRIKTKLQEQLKPLGGSVEDRKFAKGQVTFAVVFDHSAVATGLLTQVPEALPSPAPSEKSSQQKSNHEKNSPEKNNHEKVSPKDQVRKLLPSLSAEPGNDRLLKVKVL